ncbi:hypothetical protein VNO78_16351 [Psophocarpus tetragonolobus]|uniref:Uncharacterized protein n=1 Tax=Psophocarpus tetragonolobus TaxID=3891 RepID=A0AAN9SH11_PSOTE
MICIRLFLHKQLQGFSFAPLLLRDVISNFNCIEFYSYPRFVTHVDDGFNATLTNLYRERLRPEMEILDLMSSWVSHLPTDVKYKKVVGHG